MGTADCVKTNYKNHQKQPLNVEKSTFLWYNENKKRGCLDVKIYKREK